MAGNAPNDLKSNFTLSLIKTRTGRLVLGTSHGAYWFNEKSNDFTPLPGIPLDIFVAILVEDHQGVIWLGTHGSGVYSLDTNTGKVNHYEGLSAPGKGLSSPIINAIAEDSDNNIWIST